MDRISAIFPGKKCKFWQIHVPNLPFWVLFIHLLNVSIDEQDLCYLSTEHDARFVKFMFQISLFLIQMPQSRSCHHRDIQATKIDEHVGFYQLCR